MSLQLCCHRPAADGSDAYRSWTYHERTRNEFISRVKRESKFRRLDIYFRKSTVIELFALKKEGLQVTYAILILIEPIRYSPFWKRQSMGELRR